jgi:hypothetical protein
VCNQNRIEFPPFALTESKKEANFAKSVAPGPISAAKFIHAMFAPLPKRGRLLYSIFAEGWEYEKLLIRHDRTQTQAAIHALTIISNLLNGTSFNN